MTEGTWLAGDDVYPACLVYHNGKPGMSRKQKEMRRIIAEEYLVTS